MSMSEKIEMVMSFLTFLGIIFAIYKTFSQPDINNEKEIEKMKVACELRHSGIDENILSIKENHLRHLENDVKTIQSDIVEIKTILKERYEKSLSR